MAVETAWCGRLCDNLYLLSLSETLHNGYNDCLVMASDQQQSQSKTHSNEMHRQGSVLSCLCVRLT